ncbi:MAG: septation protein SpoVG family protein [Candidatus Omnitrophica bacterium]|nr:septation protein SpoVG family protein [Candidatus Omnitrophota bacterium]
MDKKQSVVIERLHKLDGSGAVKAFCDVKIADTFIVKGFKIVDGKEGMFVGLPSDLGKDGKWYETFYTTTQDQRKELQQTILEEYKREIKK